MPISPDKLDAAELTRRLWGWYTDEWPRSRWLIARTQAIRWDLVSHLARRIGRWPSVAEFREMPGISELPDWMLHRMKNDLAAAALVLLQRSANNWRWRSMN